LGAGWLTLSRSLITQFMYNQTIATTTNYDELGNSIGFSVQEKTYNYFDLLVMLFNVGIFLFIIFYSIKKYKRPI